MGGMMRLRKKAVLLTVFGLMTAVFGCSSRTSRSNLDERRAIIDDYAEIMLLQDQDSAGFDEALAAVGAYLGNRTPEQKEASGQVIEETVRRMEEDIAAGDTYTASDALAGMLKNQGISRAEYEMNANSRDGALREFIQELLYLQEYLEYADAGETAMEDLERAYGFSSDIQEINCGYQYTGVNYWFAGWGEEEVSYVERQVRDKFQSFRAEDAKWLDSRDEVEMQMNAWLDRYEAVNSALTEAIGDSWENLKRTEEELQRQME